MQSPEIPPHLTEREIRKFADECDTMFEFTRRARMPRPEARLMLKRLGLQGTFANFNAETVRKLEL